MNGTKATHESYTVYVGDCAEDYDREAFSGEGHFLKVPIALLSASGIAIWDRKELRKETYTSGLIKKGKASGKYQCVRLVRKSLCYRGTWDIFSYVLWLCFMLLVCPWASWVFV